MSILTVVVPMLCGAFVASVQPTSANAAGTVTFTGYGADSCTAPSLTQMRAWRSNSAYQYWGVYIGGSDRGCSQPNLTPSWVSSVLAMGWRLLPIWVGRQNPCTGGQAAYFSRSSSTAYSQGRSEALAAYRAWRTLSSITNVPIDYDLEAGSYDSTSCRNASKWFIDGWVTQLHVAPAQPAGVYTSACSGHIDDFSHIAKHPDFVDAADWDNSPSTGSISCIPSNHWIYHQRHKQFRGDHNATYGGYTINIDSRCSNGPVYGTRSSTSTTQACAPRSSASQAIEAAAAQAAAPVQWHGYSWLAGGPLNSQLQRAPTAAPAGSQESDPVAVALPAVALRTHDVSPDAPTVGTPAVLADGSLLVPVTMHEAGRTRVTLFVTRDGTSFRVSGQQVLAGALSPGVAAGTAVHGGSDVLVVGAGGRSATMSGARSSTFTASGLPALPQAVTFEGREGRAFVESQSCAACTPQTHQYDSTDGGRTWQLAR